MAVSFPLPDGRRPHPIRLLGHPEVIASVNEGKSAAGLVGLWLPPRPASGRLTAGAADGAPGVVAVEVFGVHPAGPHAAVGGGHLSGLRGGAGSVVRVVHAHETRRFAHGAERHALLERLPGGRQPDGADASVVPAGLGAAGAASAA